MTGTSKLPGYLFISESSPQLRAHSSSGLFFWPILEEALAAVDDSAERAAVLIYWLRLWNRM